MWLSTRLGNKLCGFVDEFTIYDAPLSDNEVKALYLLEMDNKFHLYA
jgi:hypothetical protein